MVKKPVQKKSPQIGYNAYNAMLKSNARLLNFALEAFKTK